MHALAARTSWLVCCHISREAVLSLLGLLAISNAGSSARLETYSLLRPASEDKVSMASSARTRHSSSHRFLTVATKLSLVVLHSWRKSSGSSLLANSSYHPGLGSSPTSLTATGDLVLMISLPETRSLSARAARRRVFSVYGQHSALRAQAGASWSILSKYL